MGGVGRKLIEPADSVARFEGRNIKGYYRMQHVVIVDFSDFAQIRGCDISDG